MMIHNITKEEYLDNPCRSSSIAYWKNLSMDKPESIQQIINEKDFILKHNNKNIAMYFRLLHDLKKITIPSLPAGYIFSSVNIKEELLEVCNIIKSCYEATNISIQIVEKWTQLKVFANDLWIFVIEEKTKEIVALGIADFDSEINEGSLEWIQVLPNKRGKGIGQGIVNELLSRLSIKANFVTVSGEVNNKTNPEILYRKCGFQGNDIWYVIKK